MNPTRVATVWLDGCSGCHMSLLDTDEKLLDLAGYIELVYSPFVDNKEFPEQVDLTFVEGAVSTSHDREVIRMIRERTTTLVSLGDCAVTGNIPAMRNRYRVEDLLRRAYEDNAEHHEKITFTETPHLLKRSRPLHEVVKVDIFLPGCPPPSEAIFLLTHELIKGRAPDLREMSRFGA